jgi:hypothetical protein
MLSLSMSTYHAGRGNTTMTSPTRVTTSHLSSTITTSSWSMKRAQGLFFRVKQWGKIPLQFLLLLSKKSIYKVTNCTRCTGKRRGRNKKQEGKKPRL